MRFKPGYILLLLIIIGAVLRLLAATETELAADDAISVVQASGNYWSFQKVLPSRVAPSSRFREIVVPGKRLPLKTLIADRPGWPHPPLFFILLHHWIVLLGYSTFKASLLAVIFGVLAIPMFYLLCVQMVSKKEALIATSFLTFSGLAIQVSQFIRHYSLILFLGHAFLYLTLRLTREDGRKLSTYALLVIVGTISIFSHYLFLWVFVAANIYYLASCLREKKIILRWLICQVLIVFASLPTLLDFFLLRPPDEANIPYMSFIGATTIVKGIGYMISGYFYRYQYGYESGVDQVLGRLAIVLIVVLTFIAVRNRSKVRNFGMPWTLLGVVFLISAGLVYQSRREILLQLPYYYIFGGTAIFILAAVGLCNLKPVWARWPLLAVMLIGTTTSIRWWPFESPRKFSSIAGYIMEEYQPGDLIVIDNPKMSLVGPLFIYFGKKEVDILCLHRDELMPLLEKGSMEDLFSRNRIFYLQNLIRMSRDPEELEYLSDLFKRSFDETKVNRFRHFTTVFEYSNKSLR